MFQHRLNCKFPKPISEEWLKFEEFLPPGSSTAAIALGVSLDEERRAWAGADNESAITKAMTYCDSFEQYVRWRERNPETIHSGCNEPAYVWRSFDNEIIVHHSLFFEQGMCNTVMAMIQSHLGHEERCQDFFAVASTAFNKVCCFPGQQHIAWTKAIVPMIRNILQVRNITKNIESSGDMPPLDKIELCKRALSLIPHCPHKYHELYTYAEALRDFIGTHLIHTYIAKYEIEDEYGMAEAASAVLGENTQQAKQYRNLRLTLGGTPVSFEEWINVISDVTFTPPPNKVLN